MGCFVLFVCDPTNNIDPLLSSDDPLNNSDNNNSNRGPRQYDVPDDVMAVLREDEQMRRALEQSRRESATQRDRRLREQQDREYQEALEQQRRLDEAQAMGNSANILGDEASYDELVTSGDAPVTANDTIIDTTQSFGHSSSSSLSMDNVEQADELTIDQEKEEAIKEILEALPPLIEEPTS